MSIRRILDTNRLISYWNRQHSRRGRPDRSAVRTWAVELIDLEGTDAIVTPVRIEFLCHATTREILDLYETFLAEFAVIDEGDVIPEDWLEALRLARRIPRSGRPRQLGDCLIRAIAKRLRYDVMTNDLDFPR
jgi:predicted nucleic acid-binding protein